MITTADFKKQTAKPFGEAMRQSGFKGTGWEYFQDMGDYLAAVYIESGRWGGDCSAGFAIHPKIIDKNSGGKLILSKLKIHEYEFKMGLAENALSEKWDYSDNEESNLKTLASIITELRKKAFPVIEQFKKNPNILDDFDVAEMTEFHKNWTNRTGVTISTTDIRFSWAMTILYEEKNNSKAKQFAEYGLSRLIKSDTFFGKKDFERILLDSNGA